MVGKRSLTALCCASALLLTGAGTALAADDGVPVRGARRGHRPEPGRRRLRRRALRRGRVQARRRTTASILLNVFATSRGDRRAEGRGLQDRPHDRGLQHRLDPHGAAPGGPRRGGARRRPRRERHAQERHEVPGQVRRPDPGRHGHPAREHLHRRGRPVRRHHDGALPLRRGVQQVDQDHRHHHGHRPDPGAHLRGRRRRLQHDRGQHGPLRRHRSDAGLLHVPPAADPPPGGRHRRQDDPHRHRGDRGRRRRPASRPSTSPSGSARTSRRTSPGSRTSRSSRTTWTRPRTGRTSTRSPRRTRT